LYPEIGTLDPEGGTQLKSTWCGSPVPVRGIVNVEFVEDVLPMVSWPVTEPTTVGSKVNVSAIDCPGLSVAGSVTGEAEKPLPDIATELTVTADVPVDVKVTVWVVGVFNGTPPNAIVVAFTVKEGVPGLSWSEIDRELLPDAAVRVAAWELETAAMFAVNAVLDDAAGIVTERGTVTAELLAESPTVNPPVGAEPERLTVHGFAIDPVIDVDLQVTALTVGATLMPVPLRLTAWVGALLEIVSCPVVELAVVGLNWTVRTTAWPGFRVTGRLPPRAE
jgi:hypothetical protein